MWWCFHSPWFPASLFCYIRSDSYFDYCWRCFCSVCDGDTMQQHFFDEHLFFFLFRFVLGTVRYSFFEMPPTARVYYCWNSKIFDRAWHHLHLWLSFCSMLHLILMQNTYIQRRACTHTSTYNSTNIEVENRKHSLKSFDKKWTNKNKATVTWHNNRNKDKFLRETEWWQRIYAIKKMRERVAAKEREGERKKNFF